MKIGLASDHAAFDYKTILIERLKKEGYEIVDYGTNSNESVDYPDFGHSLAEGIKSGEVDKGIAFCGTGIGISMSLNRHENIRAALCHYEFDARAAREHNDANVIVMGARTTGIELVFAMVKEFLNTEFEGGRHQRRVEKIERK